MSPKVTVVMPAYHAEATLEKTIDALPLDAVDELLLVDDASRDGTVALAHRIARSHPRLIPADDAPAAVSSGARIPFAIHQLSANRGYGGNQKQCYDLALARGAGIVVMLHPDYQYDPARVPALVALIRDGADVALGSRIRSRAEALSGGMPRYKYYANRVLSALQNAASDQALSEWHTGMRAYTAEALKRISYGRFSDGFVFDAQVLFAAVERGYAIAEIPVAVRYAADASSIGFLRSCRYGIGVVGETTRFLVRRHQPVRFVITGGLAAATNLGLYAILLAGTPLWYPVAAFVSFLAGGVVGFLLNRHWTFTGRAKSGVWREAVSYAAVVSVTSTANAALLALLVHTFALGVFVANVLSIGCISTITFFLYREVVFADAARRHA